MEINESMSNATFDPGVIQGEPFTMRELGDGRRGKSFVIPLPRGRALRIGGYFGCWCKIGPRRYTLVLSQTFIEQWEQVFGGDVKADFPDALIQGDLSAVKEPECDCASRDVLVKPMPGNDFIPDHHWDCPRRQWLEAHAKKATENE